MKVRRNRPVSGAAPASAPARPEVRGPATPQTTRVPGLQAQAPAVPSPSGTVDRAGFRRLRLDHLASGKPFASGEAKALEAIAGARISLDGLRRLYEKALPHHGGLAPARVRISGSAGKGHFAFTVTYVDNMQRRIATARRRLVRHEDGSLELYRHGTWVDPEHRGRGFAAHVLRQEVGWLSALSDHANTRLTLWAGGAKNPHKPGDLQSVGVYLWAKAGFDAAEVPSSLAMGGDKPRCEDDPGRDEIGDLELIRRQLSRWLDAQVAQGALTREEAQAVNAQAASCATYEIAELSLPGRSFATKVGDTERAAPLGQAFLLSADSPRWEGALFVNRPDSPGHARAEAYVKRALARDGRAEAALVARLQADLEGEDPARRGDALDAVGRIGGVQFAPVLQALAGRHPELEPQVRQTLLKVRGRYRPPRPKITYGAHGGRRVGFALPGQYADLAKLSAAKLAAIAVSDPDHRRAQVALQQLADAHLGKAPRAVLEAARKVYARYQGDEERWQARQTAVQILAKLPDEAGVPALVEASASEDDINVMVAIQRGIDDAEHPAAVEPAEKLGERIARMMEEIERALAEL